MTAPKTRLEQREDLIIAFAMIAQPIKEFICTTEDVSQTAPHLRAALQNQDAAFYHLSKNFATLNGSIYHSEWNAIINPFRNLLELVTSNADFVRPLTEARLGELTRRYEHLFQEVRQAIHRVPTESPAFIDQNELPFDAYLRLRRLMCSTINKLELFDPYLDADVFHRYLADVDPSVEIVVVAGKNATQGQRWSQIKAVSHLFAKERPLKYKLLSNPLIHDRHLRIDGKAIFLLGGSFKDAGKKSPYTCGTVPATPENLSEIDVWIGDATDRTAET